MKQPFHFYPQENVALTLPLQQDSSVLNILIPIRATDFIDITKIKTNLFGQGKLLLLEFHLSSKETSNDYFKFVHLRIVGIQNSVKLIQLKVNHNTSNDTLENQLIPTLHIDINSPNAQYKYVGEDQDLELDEIFSTKEIFDIGAIPPPSDSCTIPPGGGGI